MFHEKLKASRIKCEKTQKDLADYLNISPQSVSKWEKGEALPSIEYLPKIAKFYNCDINSFFEEQNTANIETLLKELKELEERFEELECEEPNEDDEEAYEEWEQEIERVEEEIEDIKDKLEIGKDGKWHVVDENLTKSPKQKDCPTEKYKEFFQIAKSVIVDNEDGAKLSNYLTENEAIKENITYLCKLIMATNSASISMLQRRMEIGYHKAGEIIVGLEEIGVVTPFDGANARKIIYEQLWKLKPYLEIE